MRQGNYILVVFILCYIKYLGVRIIKAWRRRLKDASPNTAALERAQMKEFRLFKHGKAQLILRSDLCTGVSNISDFKMRGDDGK
jgi:hypothetical protein